MIFQSSAAHTFFSTIHYEKLSNKNEKKYSTTNFTINPLFLHGTCLNQIFGSSIQSVINY